MTPQNPLVQKRELRQQLLRQRENMGQDIWQQKSDRLCQQLIALPIFQTAQTILVYQSFRQEPSLNWLFANAVDRHWGLPCCEGRTLVWRRWQPGESLTSNQYGIAEPLPSAAILIPDQIDLILVPGIGCDRRGYRLGYGGGYYDRLLADPIWQSIPTIGVLFAEAVIAQIPTEPWDCPLFGLCTEQGYFTTQEKNSGRFNTKL